MQKLLASLKVQYEDPYPQAFADFSEELDVEKILFSKRSLLMVQEAVGTAFWGGVLLIYLVDIHYIGQIQGTQLVYRGATLVSLKDESCWFLCSKFKANFLQQGRMMNIGASRVFYDGNRMAIKS